jgi:hypothetical protein
LEARCVPSVTYQGGPLLAHVGVESVFYGSAWSTNASLHLAAVKLDNFLAYLTNSTYLDQLKEYSEPGYVIGRGHFQGALFTRDWLAPGTTVTDQQIEGLLDARIASRALPSPDANRLYIIFTPPSVHVRDGGWDSFSTNPGFLGYHSVFTDSAGATVYYAVVVDQVGNYSAGPGYTPFTQFTSTASHEVAEAVTDPDTSSGWYDNDPSSPTNGEEIGDLGGNAVGWLNGYLVQENWSNLQFAMTGKGVYLLRQPNVQTFTMDHSGNVYQLMVGGAVWQRDPAGNWSLLDTGVRGIGLGPDFSTGTGTALYELTTTGELWMYSGSWAQLDSGVTSFGVSDAWGSVYVLQTDGSLLQYDGAWTTMDTGVKSFVLGPGGASLDVLETSGNLWQGTPSGWRLLDQHVRSIALTNGGFTLVDVEWSGIVRQFAA